jgi:ketosteroid isomerase-like protein
MSESEKVKARYRDLVAAVNRQDIDAILQFYGEDSEIVDYTNPTVVHRGPAAIAQFCRDFFEVLPDLEFDITDRFASETRLAAEGFMRGTPAGKTEPIAVNVCAYFVWRDGKVVSEHFYADSAPLSAAV